MEAFLLPGPVARPCWICAHLKNIIASKNSASISMHMAPVGRTKPSSEFWGVTSGSGNFFRVRKSSMIDHGNFEKHI